MACNKSAALLALGYFKLVLINIPQLATLSYFLYIILRSYPLYDEDGSWVPVAKRTATVAFVFTDLCFCIVLLCGGHKKRRSLLRVYFWWELLGVVVTAALVASTVTGYVSMITEYPDMRDDILSDFTTYQTVLWYGLANIVMQIILLVLVRRKLKTLKNNSRTDTELRDV